MALAYTEINPYGGIPIDRAWDAVAVDSDGSVLLAAVGSGGKLYLSTDRGDTWTEETPTGSATTSWVAVACDSDGSMLLAADRSRRLWKSADSGATWAETRPAGDTDQYWTCVACDADGSHMLAGTSTRLYVSTNSGASWAETRPAGDANKGWSCCAVDDDGSNMVAGVNGGRLYVYASGAWGEEQPAGAADKDWQCCACDSDCSVIVAGANPGLWFSADSAGTWTEADASGMWYDAACDDDGSVMLASTVSAVYLSVNTGASWASSLSGVTQARCACNSDGTIVLLGGERTYLGLDGYPVLTLITPTDGAILQGQLPTLVFGTANADSAASHITLKISTTPTFVAYHVDSDTATDYADWEEAASPFSSWSAVASSGATAGNRVRYAVQSAFRYDTYYAIAQLDDGTHKSAPTFFSFVVAVDATAPLAVTFGGTAFDVIGCQIVEETGGAVSTFTIEITLSDWEAHNLTKGDAIAVASGIGGFSRTWNGTVESWRFSGSVVTVSGVADDAYLSRKVATGDEASADLGQNLADFVTSYGSPLTGANIDTSTGVTMALTGGYKYLREHFGDAVKVLPDYMDWVDTSGDVHFVDVDDLGYAWVELYEGDPSA